MPTKIDLKATDGHQFRAYLAKPSGAARGAIVVIQEIFGVNSHIRSVADGYARDGYLAIAPALFDRVERNVELKYEGPDLEKGMKIAKEISMENALLDVGASMTHAAQETVGLKTGVLGFCWGGTLAWLSATRLSPAAAVGYYGGQISKYAQEMPTCPVLLHFGEKDAHIPPSEIDKIRKAHPDLPIFTYDAGHGFNCDQRKDFNSEATAIARQRTLDFFNKNLQL
jgi:carboxymethylenebutenolidase